MAGSDCLGVERSETVGGATLRYRERGSGLPIVFVHGVLANGDLWRNVVPALAGRYRCIVPDWPLGAHSLPMPADADLRPPALAQLIAGFIAAMNLPAVVLVANDTGGALAQLVIADQPERISALVLTNCDSFDHFFPPALSGLPYLARIPGFIDAVANALRWARLRRLVSAAVAHRRPEADLLQSYFGTFVADAGIRRDTRKVFAAVDNRYTLAAARKFATFQGPVGIGWGEDDLFFPLRDARRLQAAFPNAQLRTFPGSRTFVPEDRPRELAEFIAEIGAIAMNARRLELRDVARPSD